jgi:hypothetical protein
VLEQQHLSGGNSQPVFGGVVVDLEMYLQPMPKRIAAHPITWIAESLPWNVTIITHAITPQAQIGVHPTLGGHLF